MNKNPIEVKAIFTTVMCFFGAFLLVPVAMIVYEAFKTDSGLGVENFIKVIGDEGFITSFVNSFAVSALSAIIAVILASVLAYTVHYTNLPKVVKSGIKVLSVLPMLLPTMTYGFAIIYSFGKQGLITSILQYRC